MCVHDLIHSHMFTTKKWIFYQIESEMEKIATLQLKMVKRKKKKVIHKGIF